MRRRQERRVSAAEVAGKNNVPAVARQHCNRRAQNVACVQKFECYAVRKIRLFTVSDAYPKSHCRADVMLVKQLLAAATLRKVAQYLHRVEQERLGERHRSLG